MRAPGAAPDGIAHLQSLGTAPRPTGTPAAAAARDYCARALRELGYAVRERPFGYSQLPGRFGTPLFGGVAVLMIALANFTGYRSPWVALAYLLGGLALVAQGATHMMRRGILANAWLRAEGVNVEATRGEGPPRVWLVAHVDSKSQTVPMLLRVAGIVGLSLVAGAYVVTVALFAPRYGTPAYAGAAGIFRSLCIAALVFGTPVVLTFVGRSSPGALDNASGVAAVLRAAALVAPGAPVGVLVTDAEELGLAGARAWVLEATGRGERPAAILNCDGIDDDGRYRGVFTGGAPRDALATMRQVAAELGADLRTGRLTPGILVDGVAFADAGWPAVTLMRGTPRTLLRVHTRADSLARMSGSGVETAARILSRTAEALASGGA